MDPNHPPFGHALDPGGGDVFLVELLQHEGAGHAADVGEAEIAEDGGRQDEMGKRVAENHPIPGQGAVDEDDAGCRFQDAFVENVQPPRAGHPVELAVEEHQPHEPQPEDRHGIAEKAHHPEDAVGPPPLVDGGGHAHGHAEDDADERGDGGQLQGRGEDPQDVGGHRVGGQDRAAKIPLEHFREINPELLVKGQVEAQFHPNPFVNGVRGPVPHGGQDRVDGHHPSDNESDEEKPQKRQGDRDQDPQDLHKDPEGPAARQGVQPVKHGNDLLGHEPVEVAVERGAEDEVLHIGPLRGHLDVLEHDHEGRALLVLLLEPQVHPGALFGIPFHHRRLGLLGHLGNVPGVAPCQGLGRGVV